MTGSRDLSLGLVLALLLAGCTAQDFAPTDLGVTDIEFYIQDMDFDTKTDLAITSSAIYGEVRAAIEKLFQPYTGTVKDVLFRDGKPCVMVKVMVANSTVSDIFKVQEHINSTTLDFWGEQWTLSFNGCKEKPDFDPKCPRDVYEDKCEGSCSEQTCAEGYRCCSSCCVRVDYAVTINATFVVDFEYSSSVWRELNSMFDTAINTMVSSKFAVLAPPPTVDTKVIDYSPYNRQFNVAISQFNLKLYFSRAVSNEELNKVLDGIVGHVLTVMVSDYTITMGRFGAWHFEEIFCAGNRCLHGICKGMPLLNNMCSCDDGFRGPMCSKFDCRKNVQEEIPNTAENTCQNMGQCELRRDGTMYECRCKPGSYGYACQYDVCGTSNPCKNGGECVGDVMNAMICKCPDNFGGLFCEKNAESEPLTACERERRLMLFAHDHVRGVTDEMPSLVNVLRNYSDHYTVPHCWPHTEAHKGGYHSKCTYSFGNFNAKDCYCTSENGQKNYYNYYGEMDCRVTDAPTKILILRLTTRNVTMSQTFSAAVEARVTELLQRPLGGYLQAMNFTEKDGCMTVHVYWMTDRKGQVQQEMQQEFNVTSNGTVYTLSTKPCWHERSVRQSMNVSFTLGVPYQAEYDDPTSVEYKMMVDAFIQATNNMIRTSNIDNFDSVEVLGLRRAPSHMMSRRKRQTSSDEDTIVISVFHFNGEIPVDDIQETKVALEEKGLMVNGQHIVVHSMDLQNEQSCPEDSCAPGSICVTSAEGNKHCGCGKDQYGDYCHMTTNFHELIFYLEDFPWSDDYKNHSSQTYGQLRRYLEEMLAGIQGKVINMELRQNHGCMEVMLQWMSGAQSDQVLSLVQTLLFWGKMKIGETEYTVLDKPCSPDDINACPTHDMPVSVNCSVCTSNEQCQERKHACCSGCCTQVGYEVMINMTVLIDTYKDSEREDVLQSVKEMMNSAFYNLATSVYLEYDHVIYKEEELYTTVAISLYLDKDVLVEDLNSILDELKEDKITVGSNVHEVSEIYFGDDLCGNKECYHGICKHYSSGSDICNCEPGYFDASCQEFDCRKDITSMTVEPDDHYCKNGKCRRVSEESWAYNCQCSSTDYGDKCQVQVCDHLVPNACGSQGKCYGDLSMGRICNCSSDWSGIFCDEQKPENRTLCQWIKHFNSFILNQSSEKVKPHPAFLTPVPDLLRELSEYEIFLPVCDERGQFYAKCIYDPWTGTKKHCTCISETGEETHQKFNEDGKCEDDDDDDKKEKHKISLYLHGLSYSPELDNEESDLYETLHEKLEDLMEPLGIDIEELEFEEWSYCVRADLEVKVSVSHVSRLSDLQKFFEKFTIYNMEITISSLPCMDKPDPPDYDSCPVITHHDTKPCPNLCDSDEKCSEGQKCCANSCQGKSCTEVGYVESVNVGAVFDSEYQDAFDDPENANSKFFRNILESEITKELRDMEMPGFLSVRVASVKPVDVPPGTQAPTRRKRQALIRYTYVGMIFKFNNSVPVKEVHLAVRELKDSGPLESQGTTFSILDIVIEASDDCPYCSMDSFCVTQFGGEKKCACPKGIETTNCMQHNCFDTMGKDMCENEGKCEYEDDESTCDCKEGTMGKLCTVHACDYFKDDACGTGKCLGGIFKSWNVCTCPAGTGGLYCQENQEEDLTLCERHARTAWYPLQVLMGNVSHDKINIPMLDFMTIILDGTDFSIPKCWPRDGTHGGEYHSFCHYNLRTGMESKCYCTNMYGDRNGMYYDNGVCKEISWIPCVDYNPCRNGGFCQRKEDGNQYCHCPNHFGGQTCEIDGRVDLYRCPPVTVSRSNGTLGLCAKTCSNGEGCPEGQMCCDNTCGGDSCMDVGFLEELQFKLVMAQPFDYKLNDPTSSAYITLKTQLQSGLSLLIRGTIPGFTRLKVLRIYSILKMDKSDRMKRQTMSETNTAAEFAVQFNQTTPLDQFRMVLSYIAGSDVTAGGKVYPVLSASVVKTDGCPPCAESSECVTKRGGQMVCACPMGKTGPRCDRVSGPETSVCSSNPCHNGGSCEQKSNGKIKCRCHHDYHGKYCEYRKGPKCDFGHPLHDMTTELKNCQNGQTCPQGFECSANRTLCCPKENALCSLVQCENGGTCNGSVTAGHMCHCLDGSRGVFCEIKDNVKLTECQERQVFHSWVINILSGLDQSSNVSKETLENILQSSLDNRTYFPTDLCDEKGEFALKAKAVFIPDPTKEKIDICLNKTGHWDPLCTDLMCQLMSDGEVPSCENNGVCVGNLTEQICDCTGTEHHGLFCEKEGEMEMTSCQKRNVSMRSLIDLLSSEDGDTDVVETLSSVIHHMAAPRRSLFVPWCDKDGDFLYKGCTYNKDFTTKRCHCASWEGYQVGDHVSPVEPPYGCPGDHAGVCPQGWGPTCTRPSWWCTDEVQCDPSTERCEMYIGCKEGEDCKEEVHFSCVSKMKKNPCDPKSCHGNPYEKCQVCGKHGHCFNTKQGMSTRDSKDDSSQGKHLGQQRSNNSSNHNRDDNPNSNNNKNNKDKDSEDKPGQPAQSQRGKEEYPWDDGTDGGYECTCDEGYSGRHCDVKEELCSIVGNLCGQLGCKGDMAMGEICRCEMGYGGLLCNKKVKTHCEKIKALTDDAVAILEGSDDDEMKDMLNEMLKMEDMSYMQKTQCTDDGEFEKVQCAMVVDNLDAEEPCYCVDKMGDYIPKNPKEYVGFNTCEAPLDDAWRGSACKNPEIGDFDYCLNEGQCVFNPFGGKFCDCDEGYSGLFCEKTDGSDGSNGLCEFLVNAYDTAHTIAIGQFPGVQFNSTAYWIYLHTLTYLLYPNLDRNTRGFPSTEVFTKPSCTDEGAYQPWSCDYYIGNNTRLDCYCNGPNGPLVETAARRPEDLNCSNLTRLCKDLEMCPKKKCPYGHHKNSLTGCPTCHCKSPCDTVKCGYETRCVVMHGEQCRRDRTDSYHPEEREDMYRKYDGMDDKESGKEVMKENMEHHCPVCVPVKKPGHCPREDVETVLEGIKKEDSENIEEDSEGENEENDQTDWSMSSSHEDQMACRKHCRDDADCKGKQKCCGVCESRCVDPVDDYDYTCEDKLRDFESQLQWIKEAKSIKDDEELPGHLVRVVDDLANMEHIWKPECDSYGFYTQQQCMYHIDDVHDADPKPSSCFCVDRLGEIVRGAQKTDGKDTSACEQKPYSCPVPDSDDEEDDKGDGTDCSGDYNCLGNNKCCPIGSRHHCTRPIKEESLMTSLDSVMMSLCEDGGEKYCEGGSTCNSDKWMETGQVCECSADRVGPFCGMVKSQLTTVPKTACEHKRLAAQEFAKDMSVALKNETTIKGVAVVIKDYVRENGIDVEDMEVTMVNYVCRNNGQQFEPTQCIIDLTTGNITDCFCVDMDGHEIPGSRKPHRRELFCGADYQTCPKGNVLHMANGSLMECGQGKSDCGYGYSCKRSTYGKFYCCPKESAMQDTCKLPLDVGMLCDQFMSNVFFFNTMTEKCEKFTFTGCGGNKNRFDTMDACNARCVRKIHSGKCPAEGVFDVAVTTNCRDKCTLDTDCKTESHKCCDTTCGQRCLLSVDESAPQGHCPRGPVGESCVSGQSTCGEGLFCWNGVCCQDYTSDVCKIPPTMDGEKCGRRKRYFYDVTDGRCHMYNDTGCETGFNSFTTLEECCNTCNKEGRCKAGMCPRVSSSGDLVIGACRNECLADANCPGKKICCHNSCSQTCVLPEVEMRSDCVAKQVEMRRLVGSGTDQCDMTHVPSCEADGSYSSQQCHPKQGICWCVSPQGIKVKGSVVRGEASCDSQRTDLAESDTDSGNGTDMMQVCPAGEKLHCCPEELCSKKCHANLRAVCRINPCGGCKAEFLDADGNTVDCDRGLSQCEVELQKSAQVLQEREIAHKKWRKDMDKEDDRKKSVMRQDSVGRRRDEEEEDEDENDERKPVYQVPIHCQQQPEQGICEGYSPQWYYVPERQTCDMFVWGMCGGNKNRFSTPEACFASCNSMKNPCNEKTPPCEGTTNCTLTYDPECLRKEGSCELMAICTEHAPSNWVPGVFVPKCMETGDYTHKQCLGQYCWCVDTTGHYVDGLTNTDLGALVCNKYGKDDSSSVEVHMCSDDSDPRVSCIKQCKDQVCPGHPMAKCEVDLCSDDCTTRFVDRNGTEVSCGADDCKVFSFKPDESCEAPTLCDGQGIMTCDDTCKEAKCSTNPCSACTVDPCTCQPVFVHVLTGEILSEDQCKYLSTGICEADRCKKEKEMLQALALGDELSIEDTTLPQCKITGHYEPKQQIGEDEYQCVDEFGEAVSAESDGECPDADPVAQIKTTLSFNFDFDRLNTPEAKRQFKESVRTMLEDEMHVDPQIIKDISDPYRGSVKTDITFVENENSTTKGLGQVVSMLQQTIQSGNVQLEYDGQPVDIIPGESSVDVQTQSQVAPSPQPGTTARPPVSTKKADDDDDDDLSDTDIIIIACVCGGVGLLILIIVVYCCCCRERRKQQRPVDDTFDHVRVTDKHSSPYDNPPVYNQAYEEEHNYVKVRM